ncbi:glycoside hydrolase family 127 protein [Actinoallomurus purpureus]|uniref:glycoside hydrolase family 127 protein n=1 Tax=Actinoallomurus purpureus TaxID=478114 RepID=UPI002091EC50|nr:beta-L-arabinofuranosidase domain-containing protein [Actinoallomurus purpureus]MCO6010954.1 glycoside hydrolase family 127 protein [Actinoallomurus purpureus]
MTDSHLGPVSPTTDALGVLRPLPLDAVRLDPGGLLGEWQDRNVAATIPHCVDQLSASGTLENLRRVTGESDREFAGMWFRDSDIYKTLEAAAWQLTHPGDAARLRDFLDTTVSLLAKAQQDDGYLNSYFTTVHPEKRWRELDWSHELYCAGHLIQAAVAAARAGVGAELMTITRRFADLIVERFGPDGVDGVCGHPEIETALVELYRVTGHRPYLDVARRFLDLRGQGLLGEGRFGPAYFQDHLPVRAAEEVTGHAVRQLYLLAGMVDVAVETHDTALLDASRRLWDSAFHAKTHLTGAHGSRHRDEAYGDPYELPPDRAYAETCASIASFQWNWRMLLATGEHRYADEMERVLHNAVAVATAVDGRHFFYSNPLHLRTGHDGSDEDAPSQRLSWYSCPCCPPNLARLMSSLHGYLATADDDGLRIHLYGAGTVRGPVPGGEAEVTTRTVYPWDGRIELTVAATTTRPWTLGLRIPGWCHGFTVEVDGVAVEGDVRDGYLRITRSWAALTVITLDLHMPARLVAAHPRVDAVRGSAALTRGPLVYCLEQADIPDGTVLEDVRLDATAPVRVDERADLPHVPVTLAAEGSADRSPSLEPYPDHAAGDAGAAEPLSLRAVPYFLWGNRAPGPMRVWIPVAPRG